MSKDDQTPPKSVDDDVDEADDEDRHDEAAEILTNLIQNQVSLANTDQTNSGRSSSAAAAAFGGGQVGEAQQAAIQQLLQQEPSAMLKQETMVAVLDAMRGDVAKAQQAAVDNSLGEKKHAFWDTQVRP